MRLLPAALCLVAAAVAFLPRPLPRLLGAATAATVELRAREFAFIPREVTVRAGEVTFVVRNEGEIEHNFILDDAAGRRIAEIASILPDKTERASATVRVGRYPFSCNLPGHKDAGMQGMLTVRE